jgi:FkbH-like protein
LRNILISNVNIDFIIEKLNSKYNFSSLPGFNQWEQFIIMNQHEAKIEFDAVYLFLYADFLFYSYNRIEEVSDRIEKIFLTIESFIKVKVNTKLYINNIFYRSYEINPLGKISNEDLVSEIWNHKISQLLKKYKNTNLIDINRLISNIGINDFYSSKMWYLSSSPFSLVGINAIVNLLEKNAIEKPIKKVLILDLDNTLWGGVVGEDGIDGIKISESGIGRIFLDIQKQLVSLKKIGILLCIVSKNNYYDIEEVFQKNKNLLLSFDDFIVKKINWKIKSENIIEISNELNLGIDSFVFIDDNPMELEEVKSVLFGIDTIMVPEKIHNYPNYLREKIFDFFTPKTITEEDLSRNNDYLLNQKREQLQKNSISFEDFLKSLEIKILLKKMDLSQIERVYQIINKTNQFNLMTKRYSQDELLKYIDDGKYIYVADVEDKFGKNGLVFVIMFHINENCAYLDNLLMSCRVMGRQIEYSIIKKIENILSTKNIHSFITYFDPAPKNVPVKELFEKLNYKVSMTDHNGKKTYFKHLIDFGKFETILETDLVQ